MSQAKKLSPDFFRCLLRCDADAGRLFWLSRPTSMFKSLEDWAAWNLKFAGQEAFTAIQTGGYKCGRILGQNYMAHRVIWCVHFGTEPMEQIDHINGQKTDNRILNLRAVSPSYNMRNVPMKANNTSGVNGVYWDKKYNKWQASITVSGTHFRLGAFDCIHQAKLARQEANKRFGFTERHGA